MTIPIAHAAATAYANAAKTAWTEQVLYSFCAQTGCVDGQAPVAGLIMDAAGNLYGTTSAGGTHSVRSERGRAAERRAGLGAGWLR